MTTLAHISDPHFGTTDVPVREALLRELRAESVDLIVLTGDITQRARRAQFTEAREFLDALRPKPWIAIPGNHDIPLFDVVTRAFNPYRLFRRFISQELEPSFSAEDVAVTCFNATRRTRHVNGVLPRRAVMRTARRLGALPQPFKVLATHQPLAVTLDSETHNLARGADLAMSHWIDAGADLFIGGHIHLPYCTLVRSPVSARTAIVLQAGTATSLRVRHGVPNSFNRISFENGSVMHLERCDYDAATRAFSLKQTYRAERGETGWRLLGR